MTDYEFALQDADLLKEMKHGGVLAREFLRLVETNKEIIRELKSANNLILNKDNKIVDCHIQWYILAALKKLEITNKES